MRENTKPFPEASVPSRKKLRKRRTTASYNDLLFATALPLGVALLREHQAHAETLCRLRRSTPWDFSIGCWIMGAMSEKFAEDKVLVPPQRAHVEEAKVVILPSGVLPPNELGDEDSAH